MTVWMNPGPAVGLMGALMSGAAHAGGYVAPIVAAPPVAVAAEPKRETVRGYILSHHINERPEVVFDLIDGKPDYSTLKIAEEAAE